MQTQKQKATASCNENKNTAAVSVDVVDFVYYRNGDVLQSIAPNVCTCILFCTSVYFIVKCALIFFSKNSMI